MEQIKFQIEIGKVLKLLANDIYDSPYALLRENVQNAYDAILMKVQKNASFQPQIDIKLNGKQIIITDNGIGMTRDTVENNYWKAGSSGKNNEEARKAGVVGTFGIGAMANFGICSYLKIETHYYQANLTIISDIRKTELSLDKNCINIESRSEEKESGTTVYAILDDNVSLNITEGKNYLLPYVQYLDFPVYFNGELISQKQYFSLKNYQDKHYIFMLKKQFSHIQYLLDSILFIDNSNGNVTIYIENIYLNQQKIMGDIFLEQGKQVIFGTRNKFGLATIPISSMFGFGGIVNLSTLQPTAGREAISRESIQFVTSIINNIEKIVVEELSKYDICDMNRSFLNYINQHSQYQLAGKIKIQVLPDNTYMTLEGVEKEKNGKKVYFYGGNDNQIINLYANENNILLHLSPDNIRSTIQQYILKQKRIEQVSNNPQIVREYDTKDLSTAEFALYLRLTNVLKDDYLLTDTKIVFADISHQVPNMVAQNNGVVIIYLSKQSGNITQLLAIYNNSQELFDAFVKDYIRNYLYPKLASFIPSTTREGADALYRLLQRKKELYTIEIEDLGDIEILFKDYTEGKITIDEVFKASVNIVKPQKQTVEASQIGTVEETLSTIINHPSVQSEDEIIPIHPDLPIPAIKILTTETPKKVLRTDANYTQLNGFTMFMGLSDTLYKKNGDFFFEPHITKVIWGMHKIIYIFIHASNSITLYYEIELKDHLSNNEAGGQTIPTTTIISKNRIFVPVIPELIPCFEIKNKSLSFHVRYDLIINDLE
jgi:molecular chaperone HtpG